MIKSKYEEDVFINDHTSVWGSWFNKHLGWGYHCCHSNYWLNVLGMEKICPIIIAYFYKLILE